MGQSLLGIEIGNNNMKVVQGTRKGKILNLLNYGIQPTPLGAVRDGFIVDMDAVYYSISELLKKKKITEQNAAIIVQGTSIITRDVVMPYMEEKELRNILDFQKDEYFPIDVSDYQTDFKILNEMETEEGKQLNVLLVAAPNNMIATSLELMNRLKLRAKYIDIASNAISKLYGYKSMASEIEEPFSIMILDIGGQTTTATILSETNILFSRTILYGFDELNQIIVNEFGEEDYEQIEMFKMKYAAIHTAESGGSADLYGNLISNIIKPAIDNNLIQEISRFLEFYYSRSNARRIKTIYLVGGGSYLKNLDKYIGKVFNITTKKGEILENINVKAIKDRKEIEDDFLYLVNAIGLINRK
ncbi:MAG: type IV pilus assembly protein PilM [Epulopiscium sp.]|nr:type IV pilus assembly protein PilM [Candidatus Epulonipiscium sp.]